MHEVFVLLGASQALQVHLSQVHTIFLDLQRTANLVPLGLPVEYSKLCELQSLKVLFPQIAHDTRPSDMYKTLYETLRYLRLSKPQIAALRIANWVSQIG